MVRISELALATFHPKKIRGRTLAAGEDSITPRFFWDLIWFSLSELWDLGELLGQGGVVERISRS